MFAVVLLSFIVFWPLFSLLYVIHELDMNLQQQFALVTRWPYCPGGPKKLCFTTLSLIPMVSIARLSVVKKSSLGLPGQYGRRVTRVNEQLCGVMFNLCKGPFGR